EAPVLDRAVEDATGCEGQVSGDAVTGVGDDADGRASSSVREVKLLEASADGDAVAEIVNDLDDMTTIGKAESVRVAGPLHTGVDLLRVEETEPVERHVVAQVHDRALLTGHDHGRVADRDVGLVELRATGVVGMHRGVEDTIRRRVGVAAVTLVD